jgi:hypothetical protein
LLLSTVLLLASAPDAAGQAFLRLTQSRANHSNIGEVVSKSTNVFSPEVPARSSAARTTQFRRRSGRHAAPASLELPDMQGAPDVEVGASSRAAEG